MADTSPLTPEAALRAMTAAVGATAPEPPDGLVLGAEDADFAAGPETLYAGWHHDYPSFVRRYGADGTDLTRDYAAGTAEGYASALRAVAPFGGGYGWFVERLDGTEDHGLVATAREAFDAALAVEI